MQSFPDHPQLRGNNAPIQIEADSGDLVVKGELPQGLNGAYYRNGPNPQFPPRNDQYHFFAGDGMVHAFFLKNGRASYRNRYIRTEKFLTEAAAGKALYGLFGNPMQSDPSVVGKGYHVANTHVVPHAGKLLALEEGNPPFGIDPQSLETREGRITFGDRYSGPFTAHPKIDPASGDLLFFGYSADGPFSKGMTLGRVANDGNLGSLERFDAPFAAMVHDFVATDHHIVLPIFPATTSLERVMQGGGLIGFEPDLGTHIAVQKRGETVDKMRWIETDACYVFHFANTSESGNKITVECAQSNALPLFGGQKRARADMIPYLTRWTIDLGSENVKSERLDDIPCEFPRVDDRFGGRAYRHIWSTTGRDEAQRGPLILDGLAHWDLKTGARQTWFGEPGDVPGEPVFVPARPDADEGCGWVLSIVYRARENRSDLAVFNATDLARGPIAEVQLPHRVPFGFHGSWAGA